MIIVGGFSWIGTILLLTFPVLAIRDIIRAIRKRRRKRILERLEQESAASRARIEKLDQEFQELVEDIDRRREEHEQRIRELEAAVEAATDPDERFEAEKRLFDERMKLWYP